MDGDRGEAVAVERLSYNRHNPRKAKKHEAFTGYAYFIFIQVIGQGGTDGDKGINRLSWKWKNYAPIPQIILQGRWMEQLGFSIGDKVSVTYQDGKITIEKALNLADGQAYRMFGMVAEQDSPYGKE